MFGICTWYKSPRVAVLLFAAIAGCDRSYSETPLPDPAPEPATLSANFDPASVGEIHGRVTWRGEIPNLPPFEIQGVALMGEILSRRQIRPNPNVPVIEPVGKGVANAVIYLRQVDLNKSKPWDQPPVTVAMKDCQFHILQGANDSSVGFVRRGEKVRMVSADPCFHSVHAEGAAFWNFTFPNPGLPLDRVVPKKGTIDLSSGAGYCWMHAYLLVDDHPYYARSTKEGRFAITQVPRGRYDVVCWLPNWREARHERDVESGMIHRVFFESPLKSVQSVTVEEKARSNVEFVLSTPVSEKVTRN